MKDLILRFPHLAEQIFQQLDNKSLAKCREIERLWQKFIDERNYPWLRIVNIPTILHYRNTYMHLAAQWGQTDMFEMILDKEENKNAKNCYGETAFIAACHKGHMNIALILLKKCDELKIDLNVKDDSGWTAFHEACCRGHSEIAEVIIKKSSELKIHLNSKDYEGYTAFHEACFRGHSEIAEMIMRSSSKLKIDLNTTDNCGLTAFHLACRNGHIRIIGVMIEWSESLELDLKAEDRDGKTGYQLAKYHGRTDIVNLIQTKMPCLAVDKRSPASTVFSSCCIS